MNWRTKKIGIGGPAMGIGDLEETAHAIIESKGYPKKVESPLIRVADAFLHTTFSNADAASALSCSVNATTNYIKRLRDDCGLIEPVSGLGKGHYITCLRNKVDVLKDGLFVGSKTYFKVC